MKFTKKELYEIEKHFDILSGIASRNIHSLAEKFMVLNEEKMSITNDKIKGMLISDLDNHFIISKLYKRIRDKCEKERLI